VTVLIYVWYSYADHTAPGRWFTTVNYFVHSLMYTYYAMQAARFRIPRPVSIFITSIQIVQMVVGLVVTGNAYKILSSGGATGKRSKCQQTYENMGYCGVMYFSYLVLFARFFYATYIRRPPVGKPTENNGYKKCD
jgi:elongation of very long chain fatty acids protein 6